MPTECAARFGPGALCSQRTFDADAFGGSIFPNLLPLNKASPPQVLARRTQKPVMLRLVFKLALRENALDGGRLGLGISQVRDYPFLMTGHVVLRCAVLVVGHYHFGLRADVLFMLFHQVHQLFILGDAPAGSLHRRNHCMGIIDRTVMMVSRTA